MILILTTKFSPPLPAIVMSLYGNRTKSKIQQSIIEARLSVLWLSNGMIPGIRDFYTICKFVSTYIKIVEDKHLSFKMLSFSVSNIL